MNPAISEKTNELVSISPVDGRYSNQLVELTPIVSEFGLMKQRVIVEIAWFKALAKSNDFMGLKNISETSRQFLWTIVNDFDMRDALKIKEIESVINHDVKAIEYFLKEKFKKSKELELSKEFLHFALTSEDVNNLAYGLIFVAMRNEILIPHLRNFRGQIKEMAVQWSALPMLSRTHGQSASPTTLGKEIANIVARLDKCIETFKNIPIQGKLNGAVGNFNAHKISDPTVDWIKLSQEVIESLGLQTNLFTTQIEPHDCLAEYLHALIRINTILIDFSRDFWGYISLNYFKQIQNSDEIGSSTMPHKINPIDFENAEGNLGIANALANHLAIKLPISRWQRDLSDSTVLRNIGVIGAHSLLAYKSLFKGVLRLDVNENEIKLDLDKRWEVLAEAIQTVMRRHGLPQPYERLKTLTRGEHIDRSAIEQFILSLDLPKTVLDQLSQLSPQTYFGFAEELVKQLK